jgi:hypothetical protein
MKRPIHEPKASVFTHPSEVRVIMVVVTDHVAAKRDATAREREFRNPPAYMRCEP